MSPSTRFHAPEPVSSPNLRDALSLAELFVGVFRRDLQGFFPQCRFEPLEPPTTHTATIAAGPRFQLIEAEDDDQVELFGGRYAVGPRGGGRFSPHDRRMLRAIGAVAGLRYHHLFHAAHSPRLELYRGGSEDHYVAAFIEPSAYIPPAGRPSRIAATIQTLRTAALSTYENRRVSTGALLLGTGATAWTARDDRPTPPDALPYGVELTGLKSVHRLCDGRRTLFLVDTDGMLAEIVDIERWAADLAEHEPSPREPAAVEVPCARVYTAHARATRQGGHVCLVLSPNQEIKLFAHGVQAFAFAHGRWRILDPLARYEIWREAVANDRVAAVLFQTALDLAEDRQGALFVVLDDPCQAIGRLIAPPDALPTSGDPPCPASAPPELTPGDPLAKRALHYLARGRCVTALDPPVLEALGALDGALVTDRSGRLVAFGAILRHDPMTYHLGAVTAEGARTTAALVASRFGPVLKVSEDGVVSCFLNGMRVWDL